MVVSQFAAVIWDFNGTILDDAKLCWTITNSSLIDLGLPTVDFPTWRRAYEHPIRRMYENLGMISSDEGFQNLSRTWLHRYEEARPECCLHPGFLEIVELNRASARVQTILSAHGHDYLMAAVTHLEIHHHFEHILGNEIAGERKSENAKKMLERLEIHPSKVLFIGDTCHDHEVAQEVGSECILVAAGHDCPDRLRATGRAVYDSMVDLATALGVREKKEVSL